VYNLSFISDDIIGKIKCLLYFEYRHVYNVTSTIMRQGLITLATFGYIYIYKHNT